MRSYNPVTKGHPGQIKKAVDLLLAAKRPMIYTGGGVILGEASAALTDLVRLLGFPITNTLMGLGAFPANDPLFVGMLGMHGTYEANMAMHELRRAARHRRALRRPRDRRPQQVLPARAQIIHVDIDPSSISKNVPVDVPIVGACRGACLRHDQAHQGREEGPGQGGARRVVEADRRVARP